MKSAFFAFVFITVLGSTSALAQNTAPHSQDILQEMKNVQWNWKSRAKKVERMNRADQESQAFKTTGRPGELKTSHSSARAKSNVSMIEAS